MNLEHTKLGNKYTSYIDNFVRKRFVGKFLRIFCLYLGYLQLSFYAISVVYYAYQVTDTLLWSDEPRDVPYEELAVEDNIVINNDLLDRWTKFMGLVLSLIGFISAGAMLHGIKTLQSDLMVPWIIFHMLFLYLYFVKENIEAVVSITYTPAFASLFILKFLCFLLVILVVCVYYRKMHLEFLDSEEGRKGPPA